MIEHKFPNCESFELYKGIYDDASTGVFNGKVIVRRDAQKTNAFQQNNNILIGDKASINAKPQLEIFADDVKCSHGCTIGQLDRSEEARVGKEWRTQVCLYRWKKNQEKNNKR